jgi:hypothetical protein
MTQRYFKATPATYEAVRLHLDQVWGHGPNTGTTSCFEPADTAPTDAEGMVLLAVLAEFCAYSVVADALPEWLASGAVTEITREQYESVVH